MFSLMFIMKFLQSVHPTCIILVPYTYPKKKKKKLVPYDRSCILHIVVAPSGSK